MRCPGTNVSFGGCTDTLATPRMNTPTFLRRGLLRNNQIPAGYGNQSLITG